MGLRPRRGGEAGAQRGGPGAAGRRGSVPPPAPSTARAGALSAADGLLGAGCCPSGLGKGPPALAGKGLSSLMGLADVSIQTVPSCGAPSKLRARGGSCKAVGRG